MIRIASKSDLPRINELREMVARLHWEGRPDFFRAEFSDELRTYAEKFMDEGNRILLAERDGVVCGFAAVDVVHRPQSPYSIPRDYYHVGEFGVDPAYRRRGVATELVEYMKEDAKKLGIPKLELDVWAFNDAVEFYEAVGFKPYRMYMELEL